MDPLTLSVASKATLAEAGGAAVKESARVATTEVGQLAPIKVVESKFLDIHALVENTPLGERTANFFSATEFKQAEIIQTPEVEALQIRIGSQEITIPLENGGILDAMGARAAIQFALSPALDQFVRIRLAELSGSDLPLASRLEKANISLPTPLGVAVPIGDAGQFIEELAKQSEILAEAGSPRWFEARRVDYLVGEQYIPGRLCNLPIVGGVSNWRLKSVLDMPMEGGDWARVGQDVVMVISIAAVPFAPVSGWLAMCGWVAANATFGAVSQGAISYIAHQDQSQAMVDAGKGALLGAAGGLGGVLAVAKVAPAISNPLLSATASGATVGSITGGTSATIRVIENGANVEAAAKEIAIGTLAGGAGGAVLGAGSYGVSQVVSKLSTTINAKAAEADIVVRSESFERLRKEVDPKIPINRNAHMGDVHSYSKTINANLDDFAAYLKTTNPTFAKHVESLSARFREASANRDVAGIAKINQQIHSQLSGELAEAMVVEKFRPFFERIKTQARVQDGATIIDLVAEGAKQPIAISRHRYVDKGGNLAVEVKAGTEKYFQSELASGHLLKQVGGHAEFGPGLVVTTRDVTNKLLLEGGARETLRSSRSAIWRLLPYKAEIDAAVRNLVIGA